MDHQLTLRYHRSVNAAVDIFLTLACMMKIQSLDAVRLLQR